MARDLSGDKYREFLHYFREKFPLLRKKFPEEIEWSLITIPYGVRKPVYMSVEDFDDFREIEHRWLIENQIIDEYKNIPSFILEKNGLTTINTNEVMAVNSLNSRITEIKVRHSNGEENTFNVIGNIEFVKDKLRYT